MKVDCVIRTERFDERRVTTTKAIRLDSIPLDKTYYTEEGYLVDHPILTSCGIFEYANPDGSIRRELRLPEEVFNDKSLASYEGKPIIVTHDAGEVNKDNAHRETIGTILSKGYRDGDDVRAKIIIHDTNRMKQSGLRELSLGYALTLDETPGVYDGQPYDAIQRNIEINHLALVDAARAGEQARLNIDSKDPKPLKGGKAKMKKATKRAARKDCASPEELAAVIQQYNERRQQRMQTAADDDAAVQTTEDDDDVNPAVPAVSDIIKTVMDRRDRRDSDGDPEDIQGAMGIIANQDEDIGTLLDCIEQMQAQNDFNAAPAHTDDDDTAENTDDDDTEDTNSDEDDTATENDDDDDTEENADDDDECNDDEDDVAQAGSKSMNADAADRAFRQRLDVVRVADRLNIDGVENMSLLAGKKAVIKKLRPDMRLDGKSAAYINAVYDMAKAEVSTRKDTNYQRRQMMGAATRRNDSYDGVSGAEKARQRMIDKMMNGGND